MLSRMRLYHATTNRGCEGIEREGFQPQPETLSRNGAHWLISHIPGPGEINTASGCDWWVIVHLPDELASSYQCRDMPDADIYELPCDVLNNYGPFEYVRA